MSKNLLLMCAFSGNPQRMCSYKQEVRKGETCGIQEMRVKTKGPVKEAGGVDSRCTRGPGATNSDGGPAPWGASLGGAKRESQAS